jgi:hypothetical protein
MTDIFKSQPVLAGSDADVSGLTVQVSNCDKLTLTITLSVTAATLQATIALTGTSDPVTALEPTSTLPVLTTGALITAAPSGITFASNAITLNNPAIGTYEVTIAYSSFPAWVRAVYDYTSGGGTVDVRATLGAWSV